MATVWFTLLLLTVASLYGWLSYKHGNAETVIAVEAGTISKVSAKWLNKQSFKAPRCLYKIDGEVIDSSLYIRLIVEGNCMAPRGIVNGTQLLALKTTANDLQQQLKQNDIVLIYLKDTDIHKIRIFDSYDENSNLLTYYFQDGERHYSSRPHSPKDVLGIVKYSL